MRPPPLTLSLLLLILLLLPTSLMHTALASRRLGFLLRATTRPSRRGVGSAAAGAGAAMSSSTSTSSSTVDPLQARYMEEEMVVGVSFDDKPQQPLSKKAAHLVGRPGGPILHRAFSVFLFDEDGKMLLQQRAASKITFPLFWTNACCSHPLWTPMELGGDVEKKDRAAVVGCKRAAIRKLEHELGIPASALTPEELTYSAWPLSFSCPMLNDEAATFLLTSPTTQQ